jgi:tetratricopeptide (TPR) repeat protein
MRRDERIWAVVMPQAMLAAFLFSLALPHWPGEAQAQGRGSTAPDSSAEIPTHPLRPWQRVLTDEDSRLVAEMEGRITELREAARYVEAVPLAHEVLEIRQRAQGADHWEVGDAERLTTTLQQIAALPADAQAELAEAYRTDTEVFQLHEEGKYREAMGLAQRQLETRKRLLGEEHPDVAACLNNLAALLHARGDLAGAEALHREALAAKRELLGEEHPSVAVSLGNLARVLDGEGDYAGAEPLLREALAMNRKLLGEKHPRVATILNNLALLLDNKGDYAAAEALYREALAMRRTLLGEEHLSVAATLNNLAELLRVRGQYARAESLQREALAIKRRLLGEEHPSVATSLNNLAALLRAKGDYAGAEPLYREALDMNRKLLGEEHRSVATSLSNLAQLLRAKGDYVGAEQVQREAVAMQVRLLGEEHPDVATGLNNLAWLSSANGDYAGAESLYRDALVMKRRLLGDDHPSVAVTLHNLAALLSAKGDHAAAEAAWAAAVESFEAARVRMSFRGLERAGFAAIQSPLAPLAACLARNGKPVPAWGSVEANMARGLLDAVSTRLSRPLEPGERERESGLVGQLDKLDERISALLAAEVSTGESRARADTLRWAQEKLQAELTQFEAEMATKYGVAAGQVYDLGRIREVLPEDAAFLAWVDVKGDPHSVDPNGEHWGCVLRREGQPIWVKLPGSGEGGVWTEDDDELPRVVRGALGTPPGGRGDVSTREMVERLGAQRVRPAERCLPGVRHLIVLPAGWMAGVPVEALTDQYTVSYSPSATMYAWLRERSRTSAGGVAEPRPGGAEEELAWSGEAQRRALLAVGDPVFGQPEAPGTAAPEPPERGVLVEVVSSESNAQRGGLREGDVLVSYRGEMLGGPDELGPAIEAAAGDSVVPVTVWREGEAVELQVAPGKLGVRTSKRPAAEAMNLKRRLDRVLETTRGKVFVPLPWTRCEIEGIAELFDSDRTVSSILLGADASERRLHELASSGELGRCRYVHLATHAVMDDQVAMRSALILSQDPVDESVERALEGLEVYDGWLTAEQIVRTWRIDADLVTLSACETALGKESGGEGFLGFSQALFVAGARSLVLTLWKVQDTPTMLLMRRFYENLLGRFDEPRVLAGLKYLSGCPMPKAEALGEAKAWLRGLTWDELRDVEEELSSAGRGGEPQTEVPAEPLEREGPYEDPHYWAAFVLVGDPE